MDIVLLFGITKNPLWKTLKYSGYALAWFSAPFAPVGLSKHYIKHAEQNDFSPPIFPSPRES